MFLEIEEIENDEEIDYEKEIDFARCLGEPEAVGMHKALLEFYFVAKPGRGYLDSNFSEIKKPRINSHAATVIVW